LGFTHICGTNYRTGNFTIHRKTIGRRMAAKLKAIRAQRRKRMHARVPETAKWLQQVVRGISKITPFRAILRGCARFAETCCGAGYRRYGAEAINTA
jgi:hypothetical protein